MKITEKMPSFMRHDITDSDPDKVGETRRQIDIVRIDRIWICVRATQLV